MVACIAELFATAVATQTNQTVLDARKKLWLVDEQVGRHWLVVHSEPVQGCLCRCGLGRWRAEPSVDGLWAALVTAGMLSDCLKAELRRPTWQVGSRRMSARDISACFGAHSRTPAVVPAPTLARVPVVPAT